MQWIAELDSDASDFFLFVSEFIKIPGCEDSCFLLDLESFKHYFFEFSYLVFPLLSFWYSHYTYIGEPQILSLCSCFPYSFSLHSLVHILSIYTRSNLPTLSSVSSDLLLSPTSEFLLSIIVLFKSEFPFCSFKKIISLYCYSYLM